MAGANASDFFGEGVYGDQTQKRRDWTLQPPTTPAEMIRMQSDLGLAPDPTTDNFQYGYVGGTQGTQSAGIQTPESAARIMASGNIGGAGGAYQMADPTSKAEYDYMHQLANPGVFGSVTDLLNVAGEKIGVSHAGDANPGFNTNFSLANPLDPVGYLQGGAKPLVDMETGLGVSGTGRPVAATPGGGAMSALGADVSQPQPGAPVPGGGVVPTFQQPNLGTGGTGGTGTGTGDGTGGTGTGDGTTPGGGASQGVKDILEGLGQYQGAITDLAQDNTGLSLAEAQLKKASALANAQALLQTEQSQRAALGAARGVRNRNDRALAERQAVGEAAYVGQEAARTNQLARAEQEGNLAMLRAGETDADRRFKLEALQAAGKLGLDTGALQVNINQIDMADAAERMRIALGYDQLDETKAQRIMNYARDMAAIQFNYDQLSVEDQNEADRLLMQRYQIDQDTMIRLRDIQQRGELNWGQLLTTFVGGVGGGAGTVAANTLLRDNPPPAAPAAGTGTTGGTTVPSDERAKTNIQSVDATSAEFDEFMNAISANTYEYKDPVAHGLGLRFGLMAQDLEKTKLGKSMVRPDHAGVKTIEVGPLAAATASGLALVHERLQALEEALTH